MNCKDIESLLIAFLDGEASDEEERLVREHIAACLPCRRELEILANIQKNLRQAFKSKSVKHTLPTDDWERLRQSVDLQERPVAAGLIIERIRGAKMASLIFRKPAWKTGLASLLALIIIVCLVLVIPPLLGQSKEVQAMDIALADQEVIAVLEEYELNTEDIDETNILYIDGFAKMVVEAEPGWWIIVDIDTGEKDVMSIQVQDIASINEQEIINIAKTDSRVHELFDQGAQVEIVQAGQIYPAAVDVFRQSLAFIGKEIDAEDMVGFLASLGLSLEGESNIVWVNVTTGKVVSLFGPDATLHSVSVSTSINQP